MPQGDTPADKASRLISGKLWLSCKKVNSTVDKGMTTGLKVIAHDKRELAAMDGMNGSATTVDNRFAVLREWQHAAVALKFAKERETNLRSQVTALFFPDATSNDGTKYADLTEGWRLKAVFKTNYKVDTDILPNVLLTLTSMGTEGEHAANVAFRYTPELAVSAYKILSPALKAVIDKAITSSVGAPSYEIVAPK